MKAKTYSVSHLQQILEISPNELLKLIRKNSSSLNVRTRSLKDGNSETYLDEESFKRIVFIRQLESGPRVSAEEVCEMLKERFPKKNADSEKAVDHFARTFAAVEQEVKKLRTQLTQLVIKYDHCIKELSLSQSKNISLENEIKRIKTREASLMGQMRKDATNGIPQELTETDLN
jgi:septal ring factor EnvC (AmiA/AmiB activator)